VIEVLMILSVQYSRKEEEAKQPPKRKGHPSEEIAFPRNLR
jgi:hypothetical protein